MACEVTEVQSDYTFTDKQQWISHVTTCKDLTSSTAKLVCGLVLLLTLIRVAFSASPFCFTFKLMLTKRQL